MNIRDERIAVGVATGILAISLVGVGLATQITNPFTLVIPPLIALGSLAGIWGISLNNHHHISVPEIDIRLVFSAWILCAGLIIAIVVQTGQRLLYVHALQLVAFAVSGWVILNGKSRLGVVLTIVTAVVHRLSIYYASATLIGLDSLYHVRVGSAITRTGDITPLIDSKYWFSPFMHILLAINQHLTDSIPRDAAVFFLLAAVIIPIIGAYIAGRQLFSPIHGAIAAFLLSISDYVISWAIQPQPTTLGFCIFVTVFFIFIIWKDTMDPRHFVILIFMFVAQIATHQISVFITILTIGAYIVGNSIWNDPNSRKLRYYILRIFPLFGILILYSWITTRRSGPVGDDPPFLVMMLLRFTEKITMDTGRATIPPTRDVSIAGADSMTAVQVMGIAILFGLAVTGSVWLLRRQGQRPVALGLGVVVVVLSSFAFIGPIVGIRVFIPRRWFVFLYVPLTLLGAVGLVLFSRSLPTIVPDWKSFPYLIIIILIIIPFGGTMLLGYPGAADGPVLDQAPGAQRLGSTPEEKAAYIFTANSASEDITIVADHVARQQIERNFGRETKYYQIHSNSSNELAFDGPILIVDRGYDRTDHASWRVKTNHWLRVFSPLPVKRPSSSNIYDNGNNQIRYR